MNYMKQELHSISYCSSGASAKSRTSRLSRYYTGIARRIKRVSPVKDNFSKRKLVKLAAVVLAAGKGTRLNCQRKNKVIMKLAGKPMITYGLKSLKKVGIKDIFIVVNFAVDSIKNKLNGENLIFVRQGKRWGTGAAVYDAVKKMKSEEKDILVMYGDHCAFYSPDSLKKLINDHQKRKAVMTVATVIPSRHFAYGRILRDKKGKFKEIVEERFCTKEQKKIKELNLGLYLFKLSFLRRFLPKIKENPSGEYYLTDLARLAVENNLSVEIFKIDDPLVAYGVNTKEELGIADKLMKERLTKKSA